MSELNPWSRGFQRVYHGALERFRAGAGSADEVVAADDAGFLRANGIKPINIFDYVEDVEGGGEPDYGTALLLASARRDHFLHVQGGQWREATATLDSLPPKSEALEGIEWLPRIIAKARAFLDGELADDVMYCCGGDRKFLARHALNPLDFLRVVTAHGDDHARIAEYVRRSAQPAPG